MRSAAASDARTWASIGVNSFGGPAGQIAVLHRVVVDERRWVDEPTFLHALNFCMLLPGPEAMQLATYLGWLRRGVRGAAVAGGLFVLPGAVVMLLLSAAYVTWGDIRWVSGLLFGVQAAVVPVIAQAVVRVGGRALRTNAARVLATAAFLALFFFDIPFPVVIVTALLVGAVLGRTSAALDVHVSADAPERAASTTRRTTLVALAVTLLWLAPTGLLLLWLGADHVFTQEALLFSQAAVLSFGGAYAVLGLVAQRAVDAYGWISSGTMLTGLGLAETTPGPLILVGQFVGFVAAYQAAPTALSPLLAGFFGALITLWVLFLPSFALVIGGAPYVELLRRDLRVAGAFAAVSAAVVGVIADLGVWFAFHVLFDDVQQPVLGPFNITWPAWSSLDWGAAVVVLMGSVLLFGVRMRLLLVLASCAGLGLVLVATGAHPG